MRASILFNVAFATSVFAHGGGGSKNPEVDANADWMTKHMAGMSLNFAMLSVASTCL